MREEQQLLGATMAPPSFDAKNEESAETPLLQPEASFPIRTGFATFLGLPD